MSTPANMPAVNLETIVRKQFVDMIRNLDPMETDAVDFTKLFESLLETNGISRNLPLVDSFEHIIFEGSDVRNDKDFSPMDRLMESYGQNKFFYMSFLSFVFQSNFVLAKKIFETTHFQVASCLNDPVFSLQDFKCVLAYDISLASDIFRNKGYPILNNICSAAFIYPLTLQKMKQLVSAYGPEIMLWTSNHSVAGSCTNVNVYLENGHIYNTEKINKVEETLKFLINSFPLALKQSVRRKSSNVNAFTIVLELCDSEADPRHQMIVQNVFQYVDCADLHTIYNIKGQTLKDLVGASGNSLVLKYIEKKFDMIIPRTSDI